MVLHGLTRLPRSPHLTAGFAAFGWRVDFSRLSG
jgi:hypothetical protein